MDDLISRQAALECFHCWIDKHGDVHEPDEMPEYQRIEALPSAQPEQLGTDLAEVGTEEMKKRTVKGFPIDADLLMLTVEEKYGFRARDKLYGIIRYMPKYELPSVQPETAKRIVGKSRCGMTLWYQCYMCNEPVDAQDNYCRGCGRKLI